MSVRVRRATREDERFVVDLGRETSATSLSPLRRARPGVAEDTYLRLVGFALAREHVVFVAEVEDARAGFLILITDLPDEVSDEPQAFVAYMAVALERQGAGVGRALLAAAEDYARERGLPTISLMVTEGNLPAVRLYERAGLTTERRMMTKRL